MADVLINVTHPKLYGSDGKVMETGLQEVESKLAAKLIKRGAASKAEKPKTKGKSKGLDEANVKIAELELLLESMKEEGDLLLSELTDKVSTLEAENAELVESNKGLDIALVELTEANAALVKAK